MLITRLLYLYCLSYVSILKTKTAAVLSLYVAKSNRFVTVPVTFFSCIVSHLRPALAHTGFYNNYPSYNEAMRQTDRGIQLDTPICYVIIALQLSTAFSVATTTRTSVAITARATVAAITARTSVAIAARATATTATTRPTFALIGHAFGFG